MRQPTDQMSLAAVTCVISITWGEGGLGDITGGSLLFRGGGVSQDEAAHRPDVTCGRHLRHLKHLGVLQLQLPGSAVLPWLVGRPPGAARHTAGCRTQRALTRCRTAPLPSYKLPQSCCKQGPLPTSGAIQ